MIKLIDSLGISNIILNLLLNDTEVNRFDGYIETFSNYREQGYKLIVCNIINDKVNKLTVCFSKYRNSNDIVVYYSNQYEGEKYSSIFWDNAKLFKYNDFYEVVDYIKELLINEL